MDIILFDADSGLARWEERLIAATSEGPTNVFHIYYRHLENACNPITGVGAGDFGVEVTRTSQDMAIKAKLPKLPPKFRHNSFLFAPAPFDLPTVQIRGGTFYKDNEASREKQQPLFKDLNLTIGHSMLEQWAIVGPAGAGKTTLLELLGGRHICEPSSARQYPAILAAAELRKLPLDPLQLIQYLPATGREGILAGAAAQGAYLSARYESGHEESDLTLSDYLIGNLYQNPDPSQLEKVNEYAKSFFHRSLLEKLHLTELASQPLSTLSNGQTRRARIARALVSRPAMLILDEPFQGLDPTSQVSLARLLGSLGTKRYLSLLCAFQDDEQIPQFITHVLYLNSSHEIIASGPRKEVHFIVRAQGYTLKVLKSRRSVPKQPLAYASQPHLQVNTDWCSQMDALAVKADEEDTAAERPTVVEMSGVRVKYGTNIALGAWKRKIDGKEYPGLWWKVRQGERWGVFGANGAGKTTLLSLINSDHPQAYSQPVKVFGRGRLPTVGELGLSVFELQARIGQASPEIHNFFPRNLTVRQTLESAWAETFRATPQLTHEADEAVEATLRWFQPLLDPACANDVTGAILAHGEAMKSSRKEAIQAYRSRSTDWADEVRFGELDFATQRVALFLRAVVRRCDLVVLDEAFGGMGLVARIRCMLWLAYGERRVTRPTDQRGAVHKTATGLERANQVAVEGLAPHQTLLCVAHRREDVPPLLNRWIMLPPDGGQEYGKRPQLGRFDFRGSEWKTGRWWYNIWWEGTRQRERL